MSGFIENSIGRCWGERISRCGQVSVVSFQSRYGSRKATQNGIKRHLPLATRAPCFFWVKPGSDATCTLLQAIDGSLHPVVPRDDQDVLMIEPALCDEITPPTMNIRRYPLLDTA